MVLEREKTEDIYYIYILRCEDDSLYTGIAKNYKDRYEKHMAGTGAKYTRSRKPVKIERVWETQGRSAASKTEYFMKKNPRKMKEIFISENNIFADKVMEKLGIKIRSCKEAVGTGGRDGEEIFKDLE